MNAEFKIKLNKEKTIIDSNSTTFLSIYDTEFPKTCARFIWPYFIVKTAKGIMNNKKAAISKIVFPVNNFLYFLLMKNWIVKSVGILMKNFTNR